MKTLILLLFTGLAAFAQHSNANDTEIFVEADENTYKTALKLDTTLFHKLDQDDVVVYATHDESVKVMLFGGVDLERSFEEVWGQLQQDNEPGWQRLGNNKILKSDLGDEGGDGFHQILYFNYTVPGKVIVFLVQAENLVLKGWESYFDNVSKSMRFVE